MQNTNTATRSFLKAKSYQLKAKTGQVMILSVIMISGAVLSATAAVGILMIYELRSAGNVINSAKALFAADAGIECALMKNKEGEGSELNCGDIDGPEDLGNDATFEVFDVTDSDGRVIGKRSVGKSGGVARSFEAFFSQ